MTPLSAFAALARAQTAVDDAQKIRAEKVGMALLRLTEDVRAVPSTDVAGVIAKHMPLVLKASSQGSILRSIAKAFGVGDILKDLIDKMEDGS